MKIKIVKMAVVAICLLATLESLSPQLDARQTDKGSKSVWDGTYTSEQAKRGEALYAQHCSSCHGPDLSGNDEASPLTGAAFLANWDGLSVEDLTERIRVSMPPNNLGKLTRQQITDIISYTFSFNSFPPGKAELSSKAELLKQIRIDASKPKSN